MSDLGRYDPKRVNKLYEEQQARIDALEKELHEAKLWADEWEERYRLCQKIRRDEINQINDRSTYEKFR